MLSIDVSLIVIFVIVWILVGVLSKVYYNPVRRIMSKRDTEIERNKRATQEALDKTEIALQKIEEDMKSAKAAARSIREKLEKDALKEKERMLQEISQEYRSQVEKAKKELLEHTKSLKKELEPQSVQLAERIEKKILH
jgi:F0F1-type ATP synthase membrane subunit b/b'